jgi:hypothetical protein
MPLNPPTITSRFRFESFWPQMPGFMEAVQNAWSRDTPSNQNPMGVLHIKLSRTTKSLKAWSKSFVPHIKITMAVCREVIQQLEKAQENMNLSSQESCLIKGLKSRLLGLAAIQKSRLRQKSRLTWLQKGDVNSKCFHLIANARKKKKSIHSLHSDNGVAVTHDCKSKVIFDHFMQHIGTYEPRSCSLNFSNLG